MSEHLRDRPEVWPVESSEVVHRTGRVISVRRDLVRSPVDGSTFERDVVVHPGAVGVVVVDAADRVLVVSQYRHPVGQRLVEVPAGLLDVPGEPYPQAAARELFEEGHVRASDWRVLVDLLTSPGMTSEATRVFLARGVVNVPVAERHQGAAEEADLPVSWVPLDTLVQDVLAGALQNPVLVAGVLAAAAARAGAGWDALRPADAPWPVRETGTRSGQG